MSEYRDAFIRKLQAQREKEKKQHETALEETRTQYANRMAPIASKYESSRDSMQEKLAQQTVGLQTLQDFRQKRVNILAGVEEKAEPRAPKRSKIRSSKLSFDVDEGNDDDDGDDEEPRPRPLSSSSSSAEQRPSLAQPTVDSALEVVIDAGDDAVVQVRLPVRQTAAVTELLEAAKQKVPELADVPVADLVFVSHNKIISKDVKFDELSRSGIRFQQLSAEGNARDDDASITTRIVTRNWFEANKKTLRWTPFEASPMRTSSNAQ